MNENNKQPETLQEALEALGKMEAERDMYNRMYDTMMAECIKKSRKLNAIKEIIDID